MAMEPPVSVKVTALCSFPLPFEPGYCSSDALPGRDACRKHLMYRRVYQATIGPFVDLALRITRPWR